MSAHRVNVSCDSCWRYEYCHDCKELNDKPKCVEEAFGRQINDLHVKIDKMEVESKCDKEKINKLKNKSQEDEEAYLEQKTELVNEVGRFERDKAELRAKCDPVSNVFADILALMAGTKGFEQEKETWSKIYNDYTATNMKQIKAIDEANFGTDFQKQEERIQTIGDMQTVRM